MEMVTIRSRRLGRRQLLALIGGTSFAAACGDSGPAADATPTTSVVQPTAMAPTTVPTQLPEATATVPPAAPAAITGPQAITTLAERTPRRVIRNLAYVEGGSDAQKLDLYFSTVQLRPAPLAVFIHGGGFEAGDKAGILGQQSPPFAVLEELLSRGYIVASINYRLSGEASFPAAVEDCKAAIRFLRANAGTYGYFPRRIAAFGTSAGGTLVSMLGLTGSEDGLEGDDGNLNLSSRVQAVANLYGLADFSLEFSAYTTNFVLSYLAVSGPELEAAKQRASPVNYVSADDAAFLNLHGVLDQVVPLEHSELLDQRLKAAGVTSQLVVVENADHSFIPVGGQISPSLEELAVLIADFFDQELIRV